MGIVEIALLAVALVLLGIEREGQPRAQSDASNRRSLASAASGVSQTRHDNALALLTGISQASGADTTQSL
jgi:hypothetical protein